MRWNMTYEDARSVFLIEYCPECEHEECENCEIGKAMEAMKTVGRIQAAIAELEEMRYYHAAQTVRKAVK